ncbi:MAG: hypothetical protein HY678_11280 [Chloroflexi bacterium]|nr:hypothetical protein [Chloroflexota bacterium]
MADLLEIVCGACDRKFFMPRGTLARSEGNVTCPNPDCESAISVAMNPDAEEWFDNPDEDDGDEEEDDDEAG